MLTMFWSPVERRIDQCVHFLHGNVVTPKPKRKPLRLGDKLDFIKKNIPVSIISVQRLERLTALTTQTAQIRDVCVHGVLNHFDQHKIEIGKVDGKKDQHVIEVFTIDRERLERSAKALATLQNEWGSIFDALLASLSNA